MFGSAIPKRWVVSLALVGLVSLFIASYSAVWANPASATTGTTAPAATATPTATPIPTGSILTTLEGENGVPGTISTSVNGDARAFGVTALNELGGTSLGGTVTYTWVVSGCGSLDTTTAADVVWTPGAGACNGTLTVHAQQNGGSNVPASGLVVNVTVNAIAPQVVIDPATLTDGPLAFTSNEALNAVLTTMGQFTADVRGANVLPSQSAQVTSPSGSSLSISAGSLDSGDSKIVVVEKVTLANLQAPPPAQKSGSTSGTFKFGSSAITISFWDNVSAEGVSGKVRLNKPAQVCMPYTQADSDGAYGGTEGLKIWHYDGTQWVALNTTRFTNPNRVCAWTSSFSPFALGLDVAPPVVSDGATGLPVTGGYTPGVSTLILALMAGFALVVGGLFTARRARRVRDVS